MIQHRNLTCAGALLRLQMDNCMRTYATFLAQDKDAVIDCIISGSPINRQLSKEGKRLKDAYLKKELSIIDIEFANVYNQASGYIHLSEKAFYQTVVEYGENKIMFQVGEELPKKRNVVLLEGVDAFVHSVKLHYLMLNAVAENKQKFNVKQDNQLVTNVNN